MKVAFGLLIPFIGTTLGAILVFFMRNTMSNWLEKLLLGFASGVMIAASVWSLLIPAIEMVKESDKVVWVAPTVGILSGILFLFLIDAYIYRLRLNNDRCEKRGIKLKKNTMLVLAVTLHNIPEGMAVGVVFAGFLSGQAGITLASAIALALGIAIQNFPEGAIVSMPLKNDDVSKTRAFFYGMMSGIVEPIGAVITILLTNFVVPILPYLLSFAAGAMIYVVVEELIPESQSGKYAKLGTLGVALGFVVMMILDLTLG